MNVNKVTRVNRYISSFLKNLNDINKSGSQQGFAACNKPTKLNTTFEAPAMNTVIKNWLNSLKAIEIFWNLSLDQLIVVSVYEHF